MPNYGTISMADLLATTSGQVAQMDDTQIWALFKPEADAHNGMMRELISEFATPVTDQLVGVGGITQMEMEDSNEFMTPEAQKPISGQNLGLPLRERAIGIQWTKLARRRMTGAHLVASFQSVLSADRRKVIKDAKIAFYTATNYTFVDVRHPNRASLPVKALANADGMAIPIGPNGEIFVAGTHNHYMGTAAFVAADLSALILNAAEHYNGGEIRVVINQAQEAAVRAFTGFEEVKDIRIVPSTTDSYMKGSLSWANRYDRMIGLYDGAEIWVKYWAIPSYLIAYNRNAPKVLGYRTAEGNSGDLELMMEDETHPFQARTWAREYGLGTINRVGMAILYIGNATYVTPTVT